MPPVVKAGLLCDYALTADDGKLSVMGIFSNITFAEIPGSYPRFFVVFVLTLDSGSHTVRVGITGPDGQPVLPEQPRVDVQVDTPGADTNLVIDFNNLPFNRTGIFQVQLFLADRLIHSIPLSVQGTAGERFAPGRAN